jgi:hypothetical protein
VKRSSRQTEKKRGERVISSFKTLLYPVTPVILQQPVAKLPGQALLAGIPWDHHCLLSEKIKDLPVRFWYMEQTATNGWNRDTFAAMIKSNKYNRRGSLARDNRTVGL